MTPTDEIYGSADYGPPTVAILAARIMRAYPTLSPFLSAHLASELERIERAQRRHAERCCSGEDGGYVRRDGAVVRHDPDAEERAGRRIAARAAKWAEFDPLGLAAVTLQGDPRGSCLLLRLPGDKEEAV